MSVIEKLLARVKVDITAAPPLTAVEVAVIVQTVVLVCTMPVIAEIFVNVKSVPDAVDKVVQSIASSPVTVKVIACVLAVAAERAKVKVGAVVSTVTATDNVVGATVV